jgi:hypothetical protein
MHQDQPSPKRTKYDKLMGVFDRYYDAISAQQDPTAAGLVEGWESYKRQVAGHLASKSVTRSTIAAGLEQRLRELRELPLGTKQLQGTSSALEQAIELEYPEFLQEDQERLSKILSRGSIRTEREYHLVRHAIDLEERAPSDQLNRLYKLAEAFEAR